MATLKCVKCGKLQVLNPTQEQMLLWTKKYPEQTYVFFCECGSPMEEVNDVL